MLRALAKSDRLLALNVAAAAFALILHRWDCDRGILQEEVNRRLIVQWTYPDGITDDRFPSLWEMARGARPTHVQVDYQAFETDLPRIDIFAAALRRFGSIEELTIGQGTAPAVERLLSGLGSQPHMTDLYCFSGDLSDVASESLAHFPQVKNLAIVGSSFTGARFPPMERQWPRISPELERNLNLENPWSRSLRKAQTRRRSFKK